MGHNWNLPHKAFSLLAVLIVGGALGQDNLAVAFRTGARQMGMGGTGVSLANDGHLLRWNPAGLGQRRRRTRTSMCLTAQPWNYEYDGARIEMHHKQIAATCQPLTARACGFAVDVNAFQYGAIGEAYAHDVAYRVGYGMQLWERNGGNGYIGTTAKYLRTAHVEGGRFEKSASAFVVDVGYLQEILKYLLLGITVENLGSGYYNESLDRTTPVPFGLNVELGYVMEDRRLGRIPFALACATRVRKSLLSNSRRYDGRVWFWRALRDELRSESLSASAKKMDYSIGLEILSGRTLSLRGGVFRERFNNIFEARYGAGFNAINHITLDYYQNVSLYENHVRHKKWAISIGFYDLLNWGKQDLSWYK